MSLRIDPQVPTFSLGPLGGVRRRTIIQIKERGRYDAIPFLGAVLRASVEYLYVCGHLPEPVILVPAPTKRSSARKRGGDPVRRICQASGMEVADCLYLRESTQESVGLSATHRARNMQRAVALKSQLKGNVVVVDDVLTTGATMRASVNALSWAGANVYGVLALSHA
ncbi:ComF family protein [Corynebacterium sp. ES2794-CONJ1]|uniref:ComF family protein n=1 Tax=unclassified Corynebacterium TaxID=2624378 RepID=UPI00216A62CF|nr:MULTISPECIES: ComF family protein [unclassified Corynebacterium]MCS4489482.1 ComF family protein [Corynebacterium sp. ES2775-CONJ]MCS4491507.1 ComF family protein [Corynebacterium sp. ES2715-CONJ3]MCS4531393.1 ComF family protein [Corynebacterium sp. ES2730-CONJ]MCU9518780.1 ComF family protein [Corynebacterium sp. ES2794-CONJ1]